MNVYAWRLLKGRMKSFRFRSWAFNKNFRDKIKGMGYIIVLVVFIGLVIFGSGVNAQTPRQIPVHQSVQSVKRMEWVLRAVVRLKMRQKKLPSIVSPPLLSQGFFQRSCRKYHRELIHLLNTCSGTGFLIDPDGHILSNAFLVDGDQKVSALLYDGRRFEAKLIGDDMKTDLSLLKIEGKPPFPFIIPGDSDKVTIGQRIYAVGDFKGSNPSISEGIICAMHQKNVIDPVLYKDFLQTDVKIDLSNTGGPLLDEKGRVIGIADALLTQCSGFQGIGFAVPWNVAAYVAHQIETYGRVERGWLGIAVQTVLLRSSKLQAGYLRGVMVVKTIDNGPAARAGMKPGDVILSYNHKPIGTSADLKRLVSNTPIGGKAMIGIVRHGIQKVIEVRIKEKPNEVSLLPYVKIRLGIDVAPAGPFRKVGIKERRGVVITRISPGSPMERAGFEANDIIVEANGFPVRSQEDLARVLSNLKSGQRVIFLAIDHRTNRIGYVQVQTR